MWKLLVLAFIFFGSAYAQECWVETDYLLWFIKKNPLPATLVTTASFADPLPGAIGQPHTNVVLGNKPMDMGWVQGFQVNGGVGMIEANYFFLPTVSQSKTLSTSGNPGSPNFAVPIFDVSGVFGLNGIPGETIFILPGPISGNPGFAGTFILRLKSQLQSAELNGLHRMIHRDNFQLEYLGGLRWFYLNEMLLFEVTSHAAPGSPFGLAFFNAKDQFKTINHFLAAQLKLDVRYRIKKCHLDAILKGALGTTLQAIKIEGSSQTSNGNLFFLTQGTGNAILPGGIFAQPSNIGVHKKSSIAWGFETRVRTRFEMTKKISIAFGYTFLWISKVLRPGDQIDRKINSTRTALADASRTTVGVGPGPIPFGTPGPAPASSGPVKPTTLFKTSTFWTQGIDAGIQFNF